MSNVKKLLHKDPAEVLTEEWLNIKHAEKQLQNRRREIEDELMGYVESVPEGTVHLNDKIKVQFKLTRKVDSDALDKIWDDLPLEVQDAFVWEAKPVLKEYRKVKDDLWLTDVVTETEGRPTFVEKDS